MLKVNPKERITAKQALSHPWFKKFFTSDNAKNSVKLQKDCH